MPKSSLVADPPPLGVDTPSPIVVAARRRALCALAAVTAGLLAARAWVQLPNANPDAASFYPASTHWFSLAAAVLAVAFIASRGALIRFLPVLLAAALASLAGGVYTLRVAEPPADFLTRFISNELTAEPPTPLRLRGVLIDTPRDLPRRSAGLDAFLPAFDSARADLRVTAIDTEHGWARASGTLRLRLPPASTRPSAPALRAGDRVALTGLYTPVREPRNPGELDFRPWAADHGLAGWLRIPDPQLIAVDPAPDVTLADRLRRSWYGVRAALTERARTSLGPDPTPFTPAPPGRTLIADLLLGEDNPADPTLRQAFTRLGLAHILAISGFHLVVLAAVSLKLVTLTGDRGRLEPLLVAFAVVLYLVVVPASAPVVRAGLMVLALLIAEMMGRRYDRLVILAWTAVLMLLHRPTDLWSLGFQLSFGLTGLLLWLDQRFHAALFGIRLKGTLDRRERSRRGPVRRFADRAVEDAKHLLSASLLCWFIAAPFIAWHTGQFSPLAVLTTVLVTPVIVLLLWMGFATVLVALVWPALAGWIGPALIRAADLAAGFVRTLDQLPGVSVRLPAFSLALAITATGVLLYWARFAHRRDPKAWALTALIAAWGMIELARPFQPAQNLAPGVSLRADVLAAGDGACTILRTPGAAVLWDCGSSAPGFGARDLPRAARALDVRRIRTAIISHADLRHFSGLLDAADSLGLREVLITPALLDRAAYEPAGPAAAMLHALHDRRIRVRALHAGDLVDLGNTQLRILSPPDQTPWTGDDQRSLIAVIETPNLDSSHEALSSSVLLTGRLSDDAVHALIGDDALPRHAALILSGRGSARALHELLLAVDPPVILASNADPIDFAQIWAGDAEILQTSDDGAVRVELGTQARRRARPDFPER